MTLLGSAYTEALKETGEAVRREGADDNEGRP
jgi:hypothetical protein